MRPNKRQSPSSSAASASGSTAPEVHIDGPPQVKRRRGGAPAAAASSSSQAQPWLSWGKAGQGALSSRKQLKLGGGTTHTVASSGRWVTLGTPSVPCYSTVSGHNPLQAQPTLGFVIEGGVVPASGKSGKAGKSGKGKGSKGKARASHWKSKKTRANIVRITPANDTRQHVGRLPPRLSAFVVPLLRASVLRLTGTVVYAPTTLSFFTEIWVGRAYQAAVPILPPLLTCTCLYLAR